MAHSVRHAFGAEDRVDAALAEGKIDAFDILFLDGGKIGWIDKDGNKVMASGSGGRDQVLQVDKLPETGWKDVIYICGDEAYIWSDGKFVSLSKSVDVSALEEEIAKKVDEETVDSKIELAVNSITVDVVEF